MLNRLPAALAVLLAISAPASAMPMWVYARDAADFLKQQHAAASRRPNNNVKRKFGAMSESPIGFFRGGAALFYRDLTDHPALKSAVAIPLMGDLHIGNLGAYKTMAGSYAFDLNDFDDAFTGSYTWELARASVSIRLHARDAKLDDAAQDRLVGRFLNGYVDRLGGYQKDPRSVAPPLTAEKVAPVAQGAIADCKKYDEKAFLARWVQGGRLRPTKHVIPLDPPTAKFFVTGFENYAAKIKATGDTYKIKDIARRVAGLGSLSRMRYLVLVEGASPADSDDILLDLKEQGPPSASPWVPAPAGSQAERVRKAWDYFVPGSDPYLGVLPGGGADFLVRRLAPWRGEVDVEDLKSEDALGAYLDTVALATARAHARSGKAALLLKDAGGAARLVARISPFSVSYAKQVEADREILQTYVEP